MLTHEWKHCHSFSKPRMELLKGRYWKVGLLNGHAFWKGEATGQMHSPKVVAFLWFSQHQHAWFFSNMALDENMVDEGNYWEEFAKLTSYATCMAEHKDDDVIPGVVMAPYDSNLKVPYKAWCYLHWLEAINMSWAEDYGILDKKFKELEAQKIPQQPSGSTQTQSQAFVKKQASFMMKLVALITAYKMEDWPRAEYLISRLHGC